jgi:translation elongation factor EF-Tu-like GTPase
MKLRAFLFLFVSFSLCVPAGALEVAIVGDRSTGLVFRQFAEEFSATLAPAGDRAATADRKLRFTISTSPGGGVAVANQLATADIAIVVVDSTLGPTPVVRESVVIARQAGVPTIAVLMSRIPQLRRSAPEDAQDLLELEILELRELLGVYRVGGPDTVFLFDAPVGDFYKTADGDGAAAWNRFLKRSSRSRGAADLHAATRFDAAFYLLAIEEMNRPGKKEVTANGARFDFWIEGSLRPATVATAGQFLPGDNGDFSLTLASPAKVAEGARFLLFKDDRVVGLGVVSKVRE